MKLLLIKLLLWLTNYKVDRDVDQSVKFKYRMLSALHYAETCISQNGYTVTITLGSRCTRPSIKVSQDYNNRIIVDEPCDYERLARSLEKVIENFVEMKVKDANYRRKEIGKQNV